MKKIIYIILPLLISAMNVNGQTTIDSVLVNIAKNNKTIVANTKYWEAKKLEYQTGLTPYNPKVDYDYLIGTPSNAGNQTDFAITQSFDFPTVYARKKQLSNEQIKQAEFQLNANRQEVLLEAKIICIELIYRNKFNSELTTRKQNTEKWLTAFQKSLEKGQGNIMDVNKAKLQLIEINASFQENLSISNQLNQKLTELNGGVPIQFSDTAYSSFEFISDFETLEQEIEANDPVRKYLEQEKVIGQNEVSLSKSLTLPKIETGYHYQSILGQRFNGVHFGLTIPLWENKNIVKTQQAELILNEANLQDHINEHYYDIKQKYERMTNLKITLDEYQTLFSSLNNVELLDKSLSLGQISTIEYFMEMTYYYEALKNYLKTEMEYNKVVAELYKYQL
ncbi:MAG: TolC family protein [Flavobacteriales bacterium]|jgi:outer membrane protein TolC|nr:TolC family protein [Flavobacteriales bacterium]HNC33954.1 TolC family protein [Bacteroidia bacterium]